MAKFLVRVKLQQPDDGDYVKLHGAMKDRGFVQTIPTGAGLRSLPDAEYFFESELSAVGVSDLALEAANETEKKSRIVAAQMATYHTQGLDLAEASE